MDFKPEETVTLRHNSHTQSLAPGRYPSLTLHREEEVLISLKVPPFLKLTLFDEENFRGNSRIIRGSIPDLQYSYGSKIRSLIIEKDYAAAPGIYLQEDFKGESFELKPGDYDLSQFCSSGFISLKIPPGYEIRITTCEKSKSYTFDTPLIPCKQMGTLSVTNNEHLCKNKGEKHASNN